MVCFICFIMFLSGFAASSDAAGWCWWWARALRISQNILMLEFEWIMLQTCQDWKVKHVLFSPKSYYEAQQEQHRTAQATSNVVASPQAQAESIGESTRKSRIDQFQGGFCTNEQHLMPLDTTWFYLFCFCGCGNVCKLALKRATESHECRLSKVILMSTWAPSNQIIHSFKLLSWFQQVSTVDFKLRV